MKKQLSVTALFFVCMVIFILCSKDSTSSQENNEDQILSGPYLGQEPPGMTPVRFAPDFIDIGSKIFAITFSHDGKECYYTKVTNTGSIMVTKEENGRWTIPSVASFSDSYSDSEPHITPDGNMLLFGSNRPLPGSTTSDFHEWYLEKTDSGWSNPTPMDSPFQDIFVMYPTVSDNGNIYFTGNDGQSGYIYFSKFSDGVYAEPVKMDNDINYLESPAHPFIAPDESYLIYDADIEGGYRDLFISFKNPDGTWTKSVNMGTAINTTLGELCPFVSRDGEYLFFSRMTMETGDIYWVDAGIIDDMKPKEVLKIWKKIS